MVFLSEYFISKTIFGLFVVAAIGGLASNWSPDWLPDNFAVALALTLLCIDQGRMALVDLYNVRQVTLADRRVKRFHQVTVATITLELIGFYAAWFWLGLGTALVLLSQLFFNTAAKIQLYPSGANPIQPIGLKDRSPVLIANLLALGLLLLWQTGHWPRAVALILLVMVLIYLGIKYVGVWARRRA